MSDVDKRYIAPESCTWCGHKPHQHGACKSKITVGIVNKKAVTQICPCAYPGTWRPAPVTLDRQVA